MIWILKSTVGGFRNPLMRIQKTTDVDPIQNSTDAALDPNPERKVVIGSFSGNLFIFTFVETISIPVLMEMIK